MTGPMDALERSLRDGPPDEAGYRAPATRATDGVVAGDGRRVVPVGRVLRLPPVPRARAGTSWGYAIIAAVVVGLVAGGIAYTSSRIGAGPSAAPDLTFAPLTETFSSPRNGFSIHYPRGWTAKPATASWPANIFLPVGNPGLDELIRPGVARVLVASQPLASGQTEDDWLAAYFHPYEGGQACGGDRSNWPRLPISGKTGYLDASACPWPPDRRVSQPDVWFDAIVFCGGRVYQIGLDGNVDLASFEAVLAAITLDPAAAVD